MRFLVDANLSPRVAADLNAAGHDATHVIDQGLGEATDDAILDAARTDHRVIISSDTDFGALLARHEQDTPSFILLRHINELTPRQHARLLVSNLDAIADELEAGAVVSFDRTRIRDWLRLHRRTTDEALGTRRHSEPWRLRRCNATGMPSRSRNQCW